MPLHSLFGDTQAVRRRLEAVARDPSLSAQQKIQESAKAVLPALRKLNNFLGRQAAALYAQRAYNKLKPIAAQQDANTERFFETMADELKQRFQSAAAADQSGEVAAVLKAVSGNLTGPALRRLFNATARHVSSRDIGDLVARAIPYATERAEDLAAGRGFTNPAGRTTQNFFIAAKTVVAGIDTALQEAGLLKGLPDIVGNEKARQNFIATLGRLYLGPPGRA